MARDICLLFSSLLGGPVSQKPSAPTPHSNLSWVTYSPQVAPTSSQVLQNKAIRRYEQLYHNLVFLCSNNISCDFQPMGKHDAVEEQDLEEAVISTCLNTPSWYLTPQKRPKQSLYQGAGCILCNLFLLIILRNRKDFYCNVKHSNNSN